MGVQVIVEVVSNVDSLDGEIGDRIMLGENKAAERLLALATLEVPFDEGTLSETGAVVPATDPEEGAAVTFDTPYAARLHEHPEYNFQNGRKGKYVEDPALANADELGEIVANEVRG